MRMTASHAVLLTGICLLTDSLALGAEPDAATLSVVALPSQRTPVYVWPIMHGCKPDQAATDAVVRRLDADVRLQVHRLSLPADPAYLTCTGAACAELLNGEGCELRSGILVGGELDESRCDASDRSLAGCQGQLLSRVRVFRFDLENNRPTRGDYRYALCQDQRCGAAGGAVPDSIAQLIEELVGTPTLPSPPAFPRTSPEPEAQCSSTNILTATVNLASVPQPAAAPARNSKAIAFTYYTQYKHLDSVRDAATGTRYPSRAKAEQEAGARAAHFTDSATLPSGPRYVSAAVNTKSTLLPGEELLGNFWRATTLHGYLVSPPAGAAYDALRAVPTSQRLMIIFILDDETKSLGTFLIEPDKALRQVTTPAACQAGGGESAACISAAIGAALQASSENLPRPVVIPPAAQVAQRSLGCIPFAERTCPACSSFSASAAVVAPASIPLLPQSEPVHSHKWTDRFLYTALGVAIVTAGALSIADSVTSPNQLTDSLGNTAYINGLLRPAEWTAWGLAIVLAVPTAISVIENGRSTPHESPPLPAAPLPIALRCPISEDHPGGGR